MIPLLAYTFWEGDNLSWFHCYTILSFSKYNPNIPIKIYTSTNGNNKLWSSGEHAIEIENKVDFNIIKSIPNTEIINIDFTEYQLPNSISPVYKADFIRIMKGKEHGGLWFDMDILFIAPVPSELFNNNFDVVCFNYTNRIINLMETKPSMISDDIIPTGIVAIMPNSKTINELAIQLINTVQSVKLESYQIIGPELWQTCIKSATNIHFRDGKEIYPFIWMNLDDLYNSCNDYCKTFTWAIHWYNGADATKRAINSYSLENIHDWDSVFAHYLRKVLAN